MWGYVLAGLGGFILGVVALGLVVRATTMGTAQVLMPGDSGYWSPELTLEEAKARNREEVT